MLNRESIASISPRVGEGVGILSLTLLREGLDCLEALGVLFRVGAAEWYFERSKFEVGLWFVPCELFR